MAKTDVCYAFRIINFEVFKLETLYFYDKYLPMGKSSSCQIFERLSCALNWIATSKLHIGNMVHILDDFFIIEKLILCWFAALNRFQDICKYIGSPLSEEKNF